ncbi:MAG: hypothetical protein GIW95_01550 [Candidatus Eremiobacteraeota bacterium]|nr:hypothetical protein [Candidatus Eremiobacteraeota bacterium]
MITSTYRWRSGRVIRMAVIGSVLLHVLIFFIVLKSSGILSLMRFHFPKPKDEEISMSSAIRLDKRPKPVRVAPPPKAVQPRPRSVRAQQRPLVRPEEAAPAERSKTKNELSKPLPHAPLQAKTTQREKRVTVTPTAPPIKAPKQIAVADRGSAVQNEERQAQQPSRRSQFSEEQLARIQNDLSRTISRSRADTNPLIVPHQEEATAPKRYQIQTLGNIDDIKMYAGVCYPTPGAKQWQHSGLDYYYLTCNVQTMAGGVERQLMPWPARFAPNRDPFNGSLSPTQIQRLPVPGPEAGWKLQPGEQTTPEMRDYARRNGVEI